ncbi:MULTISPECIES: hypothetical protein [Prauserella salsuginis group]|uniref:Membrane protein implicated in regulation of membrane protease activity n=2 Tax=Prauserella salsuginis group TaxID=2893672 RepID=A0A839XQZ3_9PSEU|nr:MULTISPECIES: hypothetical protein [Prauserella salsuginis group]MBB3662376.1 membrane protein implicated in regulation of membrane protease activity [Prauserella sediminis]MCR3720087.1 hypothetical protein [Prauserella flava]MCR3736367.1 hypothetical protein [Prauserella salsuginis]
MLRRPLSDLRFQQPSAERVLFVLLSVAFAVTAALQFFLADAMSVWWPIVLAAALTVAAIICLYAAFRDTGD